MSEVPAGELKGVVNCKDDDSEMTPLHVAAEKGSIFEKIEFTLQLNIKLKKGYLDIAKFLLQHEASPSINVYNINGQLPVHVAISNNHNDVVQLLATNGCNILIR